MAAGDDFGKVVRVLHGLNTSPSKIYNSNITNPKILKFGGIKLNYQRNLMNQESHQSELMQVMILTNYWINQEKSLKGYMNNIIFLDNRP